MSEGVPESFIRSIVPFIVMCFGGFMALLDIQIVASSLQNIGGGLSAAQDEISWVQTAYLIAEIIVIPLSGWLTRCSRRDGFLRHRPRASPPPACSVVSPGISRA